MRSSVGGGDFLVEVGLHQGLALIVMARLTDEVRNLQWTMIFAGDAAICNESRGAGGRKPQKSEICTRTGVLNWWVGTQKWVADPFSVGRGPLPGEGNAKKKKKLSVIDTP